MKPLSKIFSAMRQGVGSTSAVVLFDSPFKVLVSTVLSQRTKDANTEAAAKSLFSKLDSPKKIASAPTREIVRLIKKSGFYRIKARYLKELSRQLLSRYNGKVPRSLEELLSLRGVGRKTANCVLVYGFRLPAVPVDVHVHRISNRIGLVKTKTPEQTETELMKAIPKNRWIELNELMVKFGQKVCLPRNPRCNICAAAKYCGFFAKLPKNL